MRSAINCLKVLMTSTISTTFKIVSMVESFQNTGQRCLLALRDGFLFLLILKLTFFLDVFLPLLLLIVAIQDFFVIFPERRMLYTVVTCQQHQPRGVQKYSNMLLVSHDCLVFTRIKSPLFLGHKNPKKINRKYL